MRIYKFLSIIAMVFTPLSVGIHYGWELYAYLIGLTGQWWLAWAGGLSAFVALESVGVLAGHSASTYYQMKDKRWIVAGLMLLGYVAIGVYQLRHGMGWSMPLLAGGVYVLVALEDTSERVTKNETIARRDEMKYKLERLRIREEAKAKRAQPVKVDTQPQAQPVKVDSKAAQVDDLTPRQHQVYTLLTSNPDATDTELAERLGISRQAFSQHKKKLNGLVTK